jgi:hypothetical protein
MKIIYQDNFWVAHFKTSDSSRYLLEVRCKNHSDGSRLSTPVKINTKIYSDIGLTYVCENCRTVMPEEVFKKIKFIYNLQSLQRTVWTYRVGMPLKEYKKEVWKYFYPSSLRIPFPTSTD